MVVDIVRDEQVGGVVGFNEQAQRLEHASQRELVEVVVGIEYLEVCAARERDAAVHDTAPVAVFLVDGRNVQVAIREVVRDGARLVGRAVVHEQYLAVLLGAQKRFDATLEVGCSVVTWNDERDEGFVLARRRLGLGCRA